MGRLFYVDSGYLGLLLLLIVAAVLSGSMVALSWLLGPKKITPYKVSPYECGVTPVGDARERFPVKFYLVAILFVLFDIEVVFLWPWMTAFKGGGRDFIIFSFIEVAIYMSTWILGFIYAIRVKAIEWDDVISLTRIKARGQEQPKEAAVAVGAGE